MKAVRVMLLSGLSLLAACNGEQPTGQDGRALEDSQAGLEPEEEAEVTAAAAGEAAPTSSRFRLGEHYRRLSPTQPTSSGTDEIEVAEVFWYGCPHCYEFEPYVERWLADAPGHVSFVRLPAAWSEPTRLHARAFYTADELGVLERMHAAFFEEIHDNGNALDSTDTLAALFRRYDIDAATFTDTFDSYAVHTRVQRAEDLTRRYRIDRVPSIVVNGKYTTNATMAGGYEELIELIDELVAAEPSGG